MSQIHIFPFELVEKGAKIALYGAGTVGVSFYKELLATNYCQVSLWVDKNYLAAREKSWDVSPPEALFTREDYDYVLIAIADKKTAGSVRRYLTKHGVEAHKIIHSDHSLVDIGRMYEKQSDEYASSDRLNFLKEIDPHNLLSCEDRMEIPIRYLFFRDLLYDVDNSYHLSLYARLILSYCNGIERESYFSENQKHGIQDFVEASKELIASMKNVGFEKEHFIPLDKNGVPQNGSHRIAAALLLEKKVWVKYYDELQRPYRIDFNWFCQKGFSFQDKVTILRTFADLYQNCGLVVLWGCSYDSWEYLQTNISQFVQIAGSIDFDFSGDYIGLKTLLYDLYCDPLRQDENIALKLRYLMLAPLKFRLLLVAKRLEGGDIYETLRHMKYKLRTDLEFDYRGLPAVLHCSDTKEEYAHMKAVLLSYNNLQAIQQRNHVVRRIFIERMERIKGYFIKRGVDLGKICVFGSSIMEVFGIREARNMAVIVTPDVRKKLNLSPGYIMDDIELYVMREHENRANISEWTIIEDDSYHFYFNGLKFVNLDLLKEHKKFLGRKKDLDDIVLIDVHQEYCRYFDDKKVLREQIRSQLPI